VYENCEYLGNESNPYFLLVSVIDTYAKTGTIHKDTKMIGDAAFAFSEMQTITIPEGVFYIGYKAFDACYRLTTIYIPKTVSYIGDSIFSRTQISSIEVDPENQYYTTINGSLYTKDGQTLIHAVQ
jgi:hypothetical protein